MKNISTRVIRLISAIVLVAASLVATASSASASGGEHGRLLIKGPGSLYGEDSIASLSVAPGTSASFAVEIRNTGSSTAQYNLNLTYEGASCHAACTSTATLTTGSLLVTQLAEGPNGYFTAPIAPGAVAAYTLKVTENKTGGAAGDVVNYGFSLNDTSGLSLGLAFVFVNAARATGTGGADQFVGASGTTPTSGNPSSFGVVTAPSVAVGKTFSFTAKLKNDSALPSTISYHLTNQVSVCASYFPVMVIQGSGTTAVDVTAAVLNGTYATPSLVHGASVTLTIIGSSLTAGEACLLSQFGHGTDYWLGAATGSPGNENTSANFLFSPAAS